MPNSGFSVGGSAFSKETDLRRRGSTNRESTFTEGLPTMAAIGEKPDKQEELESAARAYMHACGVEPNPDAVAQLVEVFLPCLKIICERPWDPNGGTWRKSGRLGILGDVRKKFERLWERGWKHGKRHDDSGFDLINFIGFYLRSGKSHWGEWGEPYSGPEE